MSVTSDLLFAYLRSVFYPHEGSMELEIDKLDEDYALFAQGLMFFAKCFKEYNEYAHALARGDLSVKTPPPENELAAPLKSLHASLKHLTWQSQQVAKGDYKQRVDFMGEFADAFNTMIVQLAERQEKLEVEILTSHKHAKAMEQSNLLLSKLMHYIPEQIFVVSLEDNDLLLANNIAKAELTANSDYLTKVMGLLPLQGGQLGIHYHDVSFIQDGAMRYLAVNKYQIEWGGETAVALVISDVSAEKKQLKELEARAYHDALTQTYNRFFGMYMLNDLLNEKKQFSMVFVDLDNLKYVNDRYGHTEGDIYLLKVVSHLKKYSKYVTVCRIGGDEFMLLIVDEDYESVHDRMEEIQYAIQHDEYIRDKDCYYSISYGIVAVDSSNQMTSSEILSLADERMYEHKRSRKKQRQGSI